MSLAEEIGQRRSPISRVIDFPWGKIFSGGFRFLFLCVVFSQCASLSILSSQSQKQPILQVGSGYRLLQAEELSERDNEKAFIQETIELIESSSPYIPKELDPECNEDPECFQALSKGRPAFGQLVPTMQAYASFIATSEYQKALVKKMIANKPEGFSQGASVVYRVDAITRLRDDPENKVNRLASVRGAKYYYDASGNIIDTKRKNYEFTFRKAATPTEIPKDVAQEEVYKIRNRGFELVIHKPLIDSSEVQNAE